MEPSIWRMVPATPSLPLPPRPTGHFPLVANHAIADVVLYRINQFDVADGAINLADGSGNPFVALAAQTDRPLHAGALAHRRIPFRADLGEVVGEDVGGSRHI